MTFSALLSTSGKENQRGSPIWRNIGLVLNSMICFTEWRSAFDGMVPRWVQLPPTTRRLSTTASLRPYLEAFIAAPSPAGPVPRITTS